MFTETGAVGVLEGGGLPWTPAREVTGDFTALIKHFRHTVSYVTLLQEGALLTSAFTFYFSCVWLQFEDIKKKIQRNKKLINLIFHHTTELYAT